MLFNSSTNFLKQKHMVLTVIGMSNVGKTTLCAKMPRERWFHYSVDYRLGTKYLRESIVDSLKKEMMTSRLLASYLRDDGIFLDVNITFSDLKAISHYLGKCGDPAKGAISSEEFTRRQELHRTAEIAAVNDLPFFIARARDIYRYPHFINDASGSLCEIIDPERGNDPVLRTILDHSVLVYIRPTDDYEAHLIQQARETPKPLYYRPEFFERCLRTYLGEIGTTSPEMIDPDHFVRWVFPHLLSHRRPRYERIARHGYVIAGEELAKVHTEEEFLQLLCRAIDRAPRSRSTRS